MQAIRTRCARKTYWALLIEGHWTTISQDRRPEGSYPEVSGPFKTGKKAREVAAALEDRAQRQRDAEEKERLEREAIALAWSKKERFTLTELVNPNAMLAFLNRGGPPPTVYVETVDSRLKWGTYGGRKKEAHPVTDLLLLKQWWSQYRDDLAHEFQTSDHNKHKPYTDKRMMTDCFASLGIRGGTVEEKRARAVAMKPDQYIDAATVRAKDAAEKLDAQNAYRAWRTQLDLPAEPLSAA